MHGRNRKSPVFPPKLSKHEIQRNLAKIATYINQHNPDIVTLQEIDEKSILSGNFNQFEFIDKQLNYPYKYFVPSCSIKNIFVSGNGILSKYPLKNCESFKFNFTFPTDRMGFIVTDVTLPGKIVTIFNLHLVYLDWLKHNSRKLELDFVEKIAKQKENDLIFSGDFNCEFLGKENSLRNFIENLNLQIYEPKEHNFETSPSWKPKKRIDWILISRNLKFTSYTTFSERLSDHLPLMVNIVS